MKRIKKLVSLMLAVAMVLGLSMTAFAADNDEHTITIEQNELDTSVHTYEAYQIFKGDLATVDGKLVLSNIEWGSGVSNTDSLLAELQSFEVKKDDTVITPFADCKTAADVAAALGKSENGFESSTINTATDTDRFADIVEKYLSNTKSVEEGAGQVEIKVVGSGYYLIKDAKGSVSGSATDTAYTRFILEVVGDPTVTVKSEIPGGDKKVYVVGEDGETYEASDANYATIGSHVSYEITSKVPNYTGYKYYYFIMNDTLSDGLTFDGEGTVAVKVGDKSLELDKDFYVYTTGVEPYTFRLAFADIMKYEIDEAIVVTYSATVNDQAKVGTEGNPNTWNLQYSNNPGETQDGDRNDNKDKPGLPADETKASLGKTPDEKTLTYLTELDITKYANEAEAGKELAGAEFTLTGTSYQVVLKDVTYYEVAADGTYYLLKDGTYTETAPSGTEYVEIGVGTNETEYGYLLNSDGSYYVPTDKTEYVGKTIYKLVRGTAADYVDVNTKYAEKTATVTEVVPVEVHMEMTTGKDGKISFKGLGAGTYTLTETVTPEGFNTLDPIEFTISFKAPASVTDGTEKCTWTFTSNTKDFVISENKVEAADGTVSGAGTGIFAANVINKSGSLLPSTGGIGTTIFYVLGTVLVLGAGILLVVRKRVSKAD